MESLFERRLREKIALTRDMKIQTLTASRQTYDDYNYDLGYLEALRRVEQLMEEVNERED